jgi:hypothetical protein
MPKHLKQETPRYGIERSRQIKLQKYSLAFASVDFPCHLPYQNEIVMKAPFLDESRLVITHHLSNSFAQPICQNLREEFGETMY